MRSELGKLKEKYDSVDKMVREMLADKEPSSELKSQVTMLQKLLLEEYFLKFSSVF